MTMINDSCIAASHGRLGFEDNDYPQAKSALKLAYQLQQFDAKSVIKDGMSGEQFGQAVHQAQLAFIKSQLRAPTAP